MTDTTVRIPLDTVTDASELNLADQLVNELADLLREAAGLPRPQRLSVRVHSPVTAKPTIYLSFEPDHSPVAALEQWADRFGTTVKIDPYEDNSKVSYRVVFDYLGVEVFAYTHVPAGTATT
jgi:hypothetical protein